MKNNEVTQKPKRFIPSFKKLLIYLKSYWPLMIVSLFFAIFGTIFSIMGPKFIEKMNKVILEGIAPNMSINFTKITTLGVWLVVLYLISATLSLCQHFIMAKITANVSKKMRREISGKINRLPLRYFDNQSYGDVLSRITNDVDTIGQALNQSLSNLVTSVTMIVGILVMLLTISPALTGITVVSIPISMGLMIIIIKISQKHFRVQQKSLGELNGHIEETYSAHSVVKIFNGKEKAFTQFDRVNAVLYKSSYKSQFLSGLMMPIMTMVGNLSYVTVCVVGGAIALKDPLFIASIVAFIQYTRLINQSLGQIANVTNVLQSSVAASERVFEFLEEKEQENEDEKQLKIENIKGKVEFKNVSFGYSEDKEIIHNFNCVVEPGQKIAIVGPTGAGKTTLVNLLMRFYEVNGGEILIDNVSIKEMNRSYVRSLFSMVLQDTWLFEGTIKDNLMFGRDVSEEELVEICKNANVHHLIKSQPNGYNMMLNEEASISQGQKQLLTIARAMIQNSPMLILDEATSSVDTRTESLIQQAMDKLMKDRTSFVIAHRLSTIKNADRILVMKDGDVIETGNHEKLMEKKGFYADLYNSQFSTGGNQES